VSNAAGDLRDKMAVARAARLRLGIQSPRYNTIARALREITAALILRSISGGGPVSENLAKRLERRAMKILKHLERYEAAKKKAAAARAGRVI